MGSSLGKTQDSEPAHGRCLINVCSPNKLTHNGVSGQEEPQAEIWTGGSSDTWWLLLVQLSCLLLGKKMEVSFRDLG